MRACQSILWWLDLDLAVVPVHEERQLLVAPVAIHYGALSGRQCRGISVVLPAGTGSHCNARICRHAS